MPTSRTTRPTTRRAPARRLTFRPRLEGLEDRVLLDTRTWTGGFTQMWGDAVNWQEGIAPSNKDDLIFGSSVITYRTNIDNVSSVASIEFTDSRADEGDNAYSYILFASENTHAGLSKGIFDNSTPPSPPPSSGRQDFINLINFQELNLQGAQPGAAVTFSTGSTGRLQIGETSHVKFSSPGLTLILDGNSHIDGTFSVRWTPLSRPKSCHPSLHW